MYTEPRASPAMLDCGVRNPRFEVNPFANRYLLLVISFEP
jgi:hypothetical protein